MCVRLSAGAPVSSDWGYLPKRGAPLADSGGSLREQPSFWILSAMCWVSTELARRLVQLSEEGIRDEGTLAKARLSHLHQLTLKDG